MSMSEVIRAIDVGYGNTKFEKNTVMGVPSNAIYTRHSPHLPRIMICRRAYCSAGELQLFE